MDDKEKLVVVSGGFDPLHIGHIRMIEEARKLGERLVIILNNDNWLKAKKGFVFMDEDERKELLLSLKGVDDVVVSSHIENDPDRSVSRDLENIQPDIFANGGDRDEVDARKPESSLYKDEKTCEKLGIKMVYNVGKGGKVQSSSWLTSVTGVKGVRTERPWGSMVLYAKTNNYWLKEITIHAGSRTSLQKHAGRGELWMCVEGDVYAVIDGVEKPLIPFEHVSFDRNTPHRLGSKNGGSIIEIGFGDCKEEDNIRLEDDYGRVKA